MLRVNHYYEMLTSLVSAMLMVNSYCQSVVEPGTVTLYRNFEK